MTSNDLWKNLKDWANGEPMDYSKAFFASPLEWLHGKSLNEVKFIFRLSMQLMRYKIVMRKLIDDN